MEKRALLFQYSNKNNREGLWKSYQENGQLKLEGNYKDDKKEGFWKWYYEKGTKERQKNYKDGELISEKCWDENSKEIDCD